MCVNKNWDLNICALNFCWAYMCSEMAACLYYTLHQISQSPCVVWIRTMKTLNISRCHINTNDLKFLFTSVELFSFKSNINLEFFFSLFSHFFYVFAVECVQTNELLGEFIANFCKKHWWPIFNCEVASVLFCTVIAYDSSMRAMSYGHWEDRHRCIDGLIYTFRNTHVCCGIYVC